jgi:ABC-type glutathione transport system ATPase component
MDLPSVDLQFSDLSISVELPLDSASSGPRTVRDAVKDAVLSLPRLVSRLRRDADSLPARTKTMKILDSISGTLRAGRMTLVIGHPGSGKTSFLKALTGRLVSPPLPPSRPRSTSRIIFRVYLSLQNRSKQLHGEVRYNGLTSTELLSRGVHSSQLVQYVSQLDEHSPYLTVRETLTFAARNALAATDAAAVDARVAEVLSLLRLRDCADTVVGNALQRGISGGELKRVTIGEGILTNARFLALDEISTGAWGGSWHRTLRLAALSFS